MKIVPLSIFFVEFQCVLIIRVIDFVILLISDNRRSCLWPLYNRLDHELLSLKRIVLACAFSYVLEKATLIVLQCHFAKYACI